MPERKVPGNRLVYIFLTFLFVFCQPERTMKKSILFEKENLIAWCFIPPFDNQQRTTDDRIKMLADLGFTKYVQDWRPENLPHLAEDIKAYKDAGIKMTAIWFWMNGGPDSSLLDESNQAILNTMRAHNIQSDLWFTFNNNYFEGLSDEEKLAKAIKSVGELRKIVAGVGGRIAMYNHMDWFGEPINQVRIIEELGVDDVGIIYNFHHGHNQIKEFRENLNLMMPFLWTVNINGMSPNGPKILPVGSAEKDLEMLQILKDSGFKGTVGIIGHTENADVRPILQKNLGGLEELKKKLK